MYANITLINKYRQLILGCAIVYVLVLLISFFIMMVFILLGGLYTSIDSMPPWAQAVTRVNPVTYFIEVIRMVALKGSGFAEIRSHMLIMFGFVHHLFWREQVEIEILLQSFDPLRGERDRLRSNPG